MTTIEESELLDDYDLADSVNALRADIRSRDGLPRDDGAGEGQV